MSTVKLPNIPSLRRHQLLLEFASLKHAPPPGVYVSLTPGDPSLWSGVLFVRGGKSFLDPETAARWLALTVESELTEIRTPGPYASAILRFNIRFPAAYPDLPPLVTFSTDIFHPLIVPFTTYTFTTGSSNADPVSATDEERLPPGGFSLRHGFPHWFGRARRSTGTSVVSSRNVSGSAPNSAGRDSIGSPARPAEQASSEQQTQNDVSGPSSPRQEEQDAGHDAPGLPASAGSVNASQRVSPVPSADRPGEYKKDVPVVALLNYIRSTFDDEKVLDSLPLEAAGDPGAWHAWRAHRRLSGASSTGDASAKRGNPQARRPGEWNWEGVWEKRVLSGIAASQSDAMLFGGTPRSGGEETIRFLNMDEGSLASVKRMIIPQTEGVHD
ncbi:hypothetical protein Plec18167_008708 [Paecilomyces lecythidis]|uniref:UBC core domain-containing protein n=1 Tax=Paecilomyces lecythidis TaxID=3004212 RepID=A0ABR3WVJ9_9EURO